MSVITPQASQINPRDVLLPLEQFSWAYKYICSISSKHWEALHTFPQKLGHNTHFLYIFFIGIFFLHSVSYSLTLFFMTSSAIAFRFSHLFFSFSGTYSLFAFFQNSFSYVYNLYLVYLDRTQSKNKKQLLHSYIIAIVYHIFYVNGTR